MATCWVLADPVTTIQGIVQCSNLSLGEKGKIKLPSIKLFKLYYIPFTRKYGTSTFPVVRAEEEQVLCSLYPTEHSVDIGKHTFHTL